MSAKTGTISSISLERVLAAVAAGWCLVLTARIWWVFWPQQDMWPLPALYLLEMAAASLVGLWGIWRADALGSLAAWAAAGVLLGFSILAGFSVGFYYLPVVGLLGLAALWSDRHAWRRLPPHLGLGLLAALVQAALILAVVRLFYSAA